MRGAVAQTMLLAVIAFGVSTYLPLLLQSQYHLDLAHTAVLATPTLIGVAFLGIPLQLGAASDLGARYAFAVMLGLAAVEMLAAALLVNCGSRWGRRVER